jgi:antitoxin VapB
VNAVVNSKVFKTGNSVAVRLPKSIALPEGTDVTIERRGRQIIITETFDPIEEKRKLMELMAELDALPKPPYIQTREPIEFREWD